MRSSRSAWRPPGHSRLHPRLICHSRPVKVAGHTERSSKPIIRVGHKSRRSGRIRSARRSGNSQDRPVHVGGERPTRISMKRVPISQKPLGQIVGDDGTRRFHQLMERQRHSLVIIYCLGRGARSLDDIQRHVRRDSALRHQARPLRNAILRAPQAPVSEPQRHEPGNQRTPLAPALAAFERRERLEVRLVQKLRTHRLVRPREHSDIACAGREHAFQGAGGVIGAKGRCRAAAPRQLDALGRHAYAGEDTIGAAKWRCFNEVRIGDIGYHRCPAGSRSRRVRPSPGPRP